MLELIHIIHLLLAFAGKFLPAKPLALISGSSILELAGKYRTRDRFFLWGTPALAIGLSIWCYFLLERVANEVRAAHPDAQHVIQTNFVLPLVFGCFIGFTAAIPVMLVALRIVLGPAEYRVYSTYLSHRAYPAKPCDATKAACLWFVVMVFPNAAVGVLLADHWTAFTDKAIVVNPLWSLGRENAHPYSQIRAVYEVKRGRTARRDRSKFDPILVVVFKDGARWKSDNLFTFREQREFVKFAASKAGQTLQVVEFEQEIPR